MPSVSKTRHDTNLIDQSLDEPGDGLVPRLAVGGYPIPVAPDHSGEILVGRQPGPASTGLPDIAEPARPGLAAGVRPLSRVLLEPPGGGERPAGGRALAERTFAVEREVRTTLRPRVFRSSCVGLVRLPGRMPGRQRLLEHPHDRAVRAPRADVEREALGVDPVARQAVEPSALHHAARSTPFPRNLALQVDPHLAIGDVASATRAAVAAASTCRAAVCAARASPCGTRRTKRARESESNPTLVCKGRNSGNVNLPAGWRGGRVVRVRISIEDSARLAWTRAPEKLRCGSSRHSRLYPHVSAKRPVSRVPKEAELAISIRDVAKLAGVSTATVSRVINGSDGVTGAAREAVLRAARELQYVPHAAARALSTGRTRTIAVLLPDMHGAFFSELIRELDQCAHAHGQSLLVASLHGRLTEVPKVFALIHGQVDGVILMAPFVDADRRLAQLPFTVPTVLLNAPDSVGDAPAITIDNAGGASQVAQHFAQLGYKDVVHIAGPADNFDAAERARGFHAAARRLGMTVQRDIKGNYSEEAGREAGTYLAGRGRRPRAVFAANDNMAVGCLEALAAAGVAVPDEVAVAGFDDIPIARFTTPPLTTVRPPVAQQGLEAFEWLVTAINRKGRTRIRPKPRTRPLPTTLIVRRSTDRAAVLPNARAGVPRVGPARV